MMDPMGARGTGRRGDDAAALSPAPGGVGPLLQRDYWAVVERCRLRPSEVMDRVARWFEALAPEDVAAFRRRGPGGHPLDVGDELEVRIAGAGTCEVRVLHRDAQSLTLGTLRGHPEAGRITFGAYRNRRGDVVFHIRSRARAGSALQLLGFLAVGDALQTRAWTDFVDHVAHLAGEGVKGWITADKRSCADEPEAAVRSEPTFAARGD